MRTNPVISIVCHVLAQSVCTNRNINAPNRKTNFPVFFFPSGASLELVKPLLLLVHVKISFRNHSRLIGTCEAPSAFSPCENLIQESQPHWNL